MNRLAKDNECPFMQDRARAHTAKLILEILKDKKHFRLLESDHWLLNSPDSNPVDFGIWGAELNKCTPRPKDIRSGSLERSHCWRVE